MRSLRAILFAWFALAFSLPLSAQYTVYTDRGAWEAELLSVSVEDLESDPGDFTGPTPYLTAAGWLATANPPLTVQILTNGWINGSQQMHFRSFGTMMNFSFPGGISTMAFGFDFDTANEDWELHVGGGLVASLAANTTGFVGVISDSPPIFSFDVVSFAHAQGGLSVDNLSTGEVRSETCGHLFRGGIADDFGTAVPNGSEYVTQSPDLIDYLNNVSHPPLAEFDEGAQSTDLWFAHSVEGLPGGLESAILEIRLRPCDFGPPSNDNITLGLDVPNQSWVFSSQIANLPGASGSWNSGGPAVTFQLDLANLPGGIDLLPKLNQDGVLDLRVTDDTRVDYLQLHLVSSAIDASDPNLSFDQDPLVVSSFTDFTVSGALPGENIYFLYSTAGVGDGPCVLALGNMCLCLLNTVVLFDVVNTGLGTSATSTKWIPPMLVPFYVGTQAVIPRGIGGFNSVMTHTIYAPVFL